MIISQVLVDIASERERQLGEEGHSRARDDKHERGQLALAAAARAIEAANQTGNGAPHDRWTMAFNLWPFGEFPRRKDPRRALVIAGALIVAEIERLDRRKGPAE